VQVSASIPQAQGGCSMITLEIVFKDQQSDVTFFEVCIVLMNNNLDWLQENDN
jgi:hypothetical protein